MLMIRCHTTTCNNYYVITWTLLWLANDQIELSCVMGVSLGEYMGRVFGKSHNGGMGDCKHPPNSLLVRNFRLPLSRDGEGN